MRNGRSLIILPRREEALRLHVNRKRFPDERKYCDTIEEPFSSNFSYKPLPGSGIPCPKAYMAPPQPNSPSHCLTEARRYSFRPVAERLCFYLETIGLWHPDLQNPNIIMPPPRVIDYKSSIQHVLVLAEKD